MTGWWYRASQEQKLAQVDAGIELGMTAQAVALVVGANVRTVRSFSHSHSREFGSVEMHEKRSQAVKRSFSKASASVAYFRGEAVDLWREGLQDRSIRPSGEPEEIILE